MNNNFNNNCCNIRPPKPSIQPIYFVGATGPTGPTGATGPAGNYATALIDSDGRQTVEPNALVDLGRVINSTGTAITFTSPSTVTLQEEGAYYILFASLISNSSAAGDVGATLLVNSTEAMNASQYIAATTAETQMILQHSLNITAPTTITITNKASVSNIFHDASLSIIKIG